jgi:hypothetical protein
MCIQRSQSTSDILDPYTVNPATLSSAHNWTQLEETGERGKGDEENIRSMERNMKKHET